MTSSRTRLLMMILIVLIVIAGLGAWFAWYKFFREEPEAEWTAENGHSSQDIRFMYGSIGAERDSGIPYWIVYVLPRIFPDKLPGPGGYASFGLAWDQGKDLPIGFTTKVIGFKRVAQNCALCHTASYRTKPNELPTFVPTGPAHTFNLEAFFRFLVNCAKDSRFSSDNLMSEINQSKPKDFTFIDGLIYRYILIPITKKRLLALEPRLAWIYRHDPPENWPDWGRGRDDAMNLTKYFLTDSKVDDTFGPTDMPSIWNLKKYKINDQKELIPAFDSCGKGYGRTRMNLAGDSCNARSVIIDSALGLLHGAPPSNQKFLDEVKWLEDYASNYPSPPYPFKIDDAAAWRGQATFIRECARCHASAVTGTVMSLTEKDPQTQQFLGTDRTRIDSWNKDGAIHANEAVRHFGISREGLVQDNPVGYVRSFLDGIWLRAPYLHNGSVPTLRDLLKPAAARPKVFYRGYDLYDPCDAGFVSLEAQADRLEDQADLPPDPSGCVKGTAVSTADPAKAAKRRWWKDALRAVTPYEVRVPRPCKQDETAPCYAEVRSNGNGGHEFGVALPDNEKDDLIEYLKGYCDPAADPEHCNKDLYPHYYKQ